MKNQEKEIYLRAKFFKDFKRNYNEHSVKDFSCKIDENDSLLNLTVMLGQGAQAVFVTYAKAGGSMIATYIRPTAMAKNTTNKELIEHNKKMLDTIRKTLDPVFGRPVVSYDSTNDELGIILSSTYEWVQREKEAETMRDIKSGKGLEIYYSVFNVQDLREDQMGG